MVDWLAKQKTADRLIAKFGQSGAVRKIDVGGDQIQEFSVTFVVLDYTPGERDGDLIRKEDRKVLMSAKGLPAEPTAEDRLVDSSGMVYRIIAVRPLNPAGTPVFYDVQVRS